MKIINIKQGSEEWYKFRSQGVGASDISVIMGTNPYKDTVKLWNEKCGYYVPRITEPMRYGMHTEPIAREWMNFHFGYDLQPICIEHENESIFKASLDGYDELNKTIVEIKCPVNRKTIEAFKDSKQIHPYWIDQIQWQLALSKAERALIAIWDNETNSCLVADILADEERHELMFKKAREFWDYVKRGIQPPPPDIKFENIEDDNLKLLVSELKKIVNKKKVYSEREKELKQQILCYASGKPFYAYGMKGLLAKAPKKYNFKQMELDGIDLNKYIEASSKTSYRFTFSKT